MQTRANLIRLLAVVGLFALSGCVTRSYRLAPKSVAPAVALILSTTAPVGSGPEVTLQSVIIYRGPGSWKREALWDEYVISVRNMGDSALTVTQVSLQDGRGELLLPGDHPWKLERASKTWWQTNAVRQTGTYLALGAGAAVGAGAMMSAAFAGMWGGAVSGGTAAAGTVGAASLLALPVVAGGTVYMNLHRKSQVQDEFNRRRLVLPMTVAPGATMRGSCFFRVTPAPARLGLRFQRTEGMEETGIDLAALSGLHIAQRPAARSASK
jgi:hypothetical protein